MTLAPRSTRRVATSRVDGATGPTGRRRPASWLRVLAALGFAGFALSQVGCATYVAITMDGPTNDREVAIGMHRSEVETIVRQSAVSQFDVHNQIEARYEYSDGPAGWTKLRAILYLGADFFTLFLSELIFWPVELYADDQIERIATARYDENQLLQQWTVRREANSEVLYAVMGEPARPTQPQYARQEAQPTGPPSPPPLPANPALQSRRPASNRTSPAVAADGSVGSSSASTGSSQPQARPRQYAARRSRAQPAAPPAVGGIDFGRYHALVIGNNDYSSLPPLRTATGDAEAMAELLEVEYGFQVELLIDASRSQIVSSLYRYRQQMNETDNLLIYYAGHGWLDDETGRGYWMPVDATPEDPANWVSNATITDLLKGNPAKHVMVVADTCYSGALTRGIKIPQRSDAYLKKLATKRARTALTSGGTEPVEDGTGDHSVFAQALMDALVENEGVMDAQTLFGQIRRPVMLGAQQTPEYGDIRLAGHEGGDFLFVRPTE